MAEHLTETVVKEAATKRPASGYSITYDDDVHGFGIRTTAAGAQAFILNYRTKKGRDRRYTIGKAGAWSVAAARTEAKELKRRVDQGGDPVGELKTMRKAPTVADLCKRFDEEHLLKKRPSTVTEYRAIIAKYILPAMKHLKVDEVTYSDVNAMHGKIAAKYRANRAVAILSKMFSLAIKWEMRTNNPAKGIERNPEVKRATYLTPEQLAPLTVALAEHPDQQAANILRLLLLTGARSEEVKSARWEQFDLTSGVWTKPGATTKQKTEHRVPLSGAARLLLAELLEKRAKDEPFVFPGDGKDGYRAEIRKTWKAITAAAGITGVRPHDLRHSYASFLASAGLSLPVIGALLGHTQPATTARYSHLLDDPLRKATETVGALVTGRPSAEVIPLRKGGAA